jgi:uncharacterized membrane protein YphA (DoxX/SURF4 family)
MNMFDKILKNPWFVAVVSIVLGYTFVFSSFHKTEEPLDFAKVLFNYHILPGEVINIIAIYMPWFEVVAGLALISAYLRRGAALGIALLCVVFILVLGFNIYRGHPTVCGCFGTYAAGEAWTPELKFAKMWAEIYLDMFLLALALLVLYGTGETAAIASWRKEPHIRGA